MGNYKDQRLGYRKSYKGPACGLHFYKYSLVVVHYDPKVPGQVGCCIECVNPIQEDRNKVFAQQYALPRRRFFGEQLIIRTEFIDSVDVEEYIFS